MFFGHCHRTRFRDSFCLASVFEMTVHLLTYLLTNQSLHLNSVPLVPRLDTEQKIRGATQITYISDKQRHIISCPVSEMTYTVSSGTLNPSIPYLLSAAAHILSVLSHCWLGDWKGIWPKKNLASAIPECSFFFGRPMGWGIRSNLV